jgi:hypothetical protein
MKGQGIMKARILLLVVASAASVARCDDATQNPFSGKTEKGDFRLWTDSTGRFRLTAKLESMKDETVTLVKEDGKRIQLSVERLSGSDQDWIKDTLAERKTTRDKKLVAKRQEHQSWLVQCVGQRDVVKDNPTAVASLSRSGPSIQNHHNYYHTTEKYHYMQAFQGELVSYSGTDVTISVCIYRDERGVENYAIGRLVSKINKTFNYNNLGKNDQIFLRDYRKLETGE